MSACNLFPPTLLHSENLHHADEDVDEIELQRDALVDRVLLHQATLSKPGVVENFLHVVESEATEDSQTSVEPDVLRPHECAGGSDRKDERCKTRKRDNSDTREKGTTQIQVLLLLGGCANESDGSHHAHGVQTSACEYTGSEEEHR